MEKEENSETNAKQEQIHDLLFNREIGWQEIIYDLINTEQLDPWNIDITLLSNKYMEKLDELEEDYFISSKVLLAAALLLRIKSEILLNRYIKSIDEILFGNEKKESKPIERIELEDEIPELVSKSPLPRFRKVTLKELIDSLDKAIITENRRMERKVIEVNAFREAGISLPKKKFNIHNKINEIYEKLLEGLKEEDRIHFRHLSSEEKSEKILVFSSLLHLENQRKIWIEQDEHFGDIHIWFKKIYFKKNDPFKDLREDNQSS
tara:strand:+ start:45 stop:836 length:792 start_codon:yes stop_codon:yes gene_type:complete